MLDGTISVEANAETNVLRREDALLIPRGTLYFVSGTGRFVVVTSPAWYLEQYEMRERP